MHVPLMLEEDQWQELKEDLKNLYLTKEQVEEAQGKGYVKRGGIWQPENRSVAEVWNALGRGRDLKDHAELAYQKSNDVERVLDLYFDREIITKITLRSCALFNLDARSSCLLNQSLDGEYGYLIGVKSDILE